jgi:hypothetical protein
VKAYLHSLKEENERGGRHVEGDVQSIKKVEGDNCYIATLMDGRKATAIFNPWLGYMVDDVYGVVK